VLTLHCARVVFRSAARLAAVAVFSACAWNAAHADSMVVGGCIGGYHSFNCVAHWGSYSDPYIRSLRPETEAEKEISAARDHEWKAHCRPAVFQDQYGVPRYEYAAPGCEFGVLK
jgi:hypothetical protein